ncbi:MAG: hypothetical protein MJZ68_03190, partial [archaeon]|nr:hypothetical protein [archaeon]
FGEIFYYSEYLLKLFDGSLSTGREIACIATVMLLILMIPLMLSSLYFVRRHMSARNWKRLQYFSYLFYFGLLLHIMGLYGNFNGGDFLGGKHALALEAYMCIWIPYFILRISKYIYCWKNKVKADPDMMIQNEDSDNGPSYVDTVKTR